jgi:hypothetical protein
MIRGVVMKVVDGERRFSLQVMERGDQWSQKITPFVEVQFISCPLLALDTFNIIRAAAYEV